MNFSSMCFAARAHLRDRGCAVSHTQVLELGSALLGYRTYAALKADTAGSEVLAEADHVILQPQEFHRRFGELGLDLSIAPVCLESISVAFEESMTGEEGSCQVHRAISDFEEFIFVDVQERAFEDDEVMIAYAGTNATADEFYVDYCEYEPVVGTNGQWSLKASGTHTGDQDEDRPYSGHSGDFVATYTFAKDGRSGLVVLDVEFELDFSRDYS